MGGVSVGDVINGKYKILRAIGEGGMGAVFAVEHVGLRQQRAIKMLLPAVALSPDIVARFRREAMIVARLRSEHAVRIHDIAEHDGHPFLVMELLDGEDLKALVKRRGPLPESEAVELMLQACDALAEAHALGIVHRDLKPANIFLTHHHSGTPCIKILDFGIARLTDPQIQPEDTDKTVTGAVIGSPQYMSPEQIESFSRVDARSDIWSLGVVLYVLVTARHPFEARPMEAVYARVLHDPPARPDRFRPDLSPEIQTILLRCLQKMPEARFQTVRDLMGALQCLPSRSLATSPARSSGPPLHSSEPAPHRTRTLPMRRPSSPALERKALDFGAGVRTRRLAGGAIFAILFVSGAALMRARWRRAEIAIEQSLPPDLFSLSSKEIEMSANDGVMNSAPAAPPEAKPPKMNFPSANPPNRSAPTAVAPSAPPPTAETPRVDLAATGSAPTSASSPNPAEDSGGPPPEPRISPSAAPTISGTTAADLRPRAPKMRAHPQD